MRAAVEEPDALVEAASIRPLLNLAIQGNSKRLKLSKHLGPQRLHCGVEILVLQEEIFNLEDVQL